MKLEREESEEEGEQKDLMVAVKRPRVEFVSDAADDLVWFVKEADVIRQLHHPNIINFIGVGAYEEERSHSEREELMFGNLFMVEEYVGSQTLRDVVLQKWRTKSRRSKQFYSFSNAWKWITQMASGLSYLHSLDPSIIHRDFKPENVIISDSTNNSERQAVIVDFGVHKAIKGRKLQHFKDLLHEHSQRREQIAALHQTERQQLPHRVSSSKSEPATTPSMEISPIGHQHSLPWSDMTSAPVTDMSGSPQTKVYVKERKHHGSSAAIRALWYGLKEEDVGKEFGVESSPQLQQTADMPGSIEEQLLSELLQHKKNSKLLESMSGLSSGKVNSLMYMAPEVYNCLGMYDERIDVFAFGLVMYECLKGQLNIGRPVTKAQQMKWDQLKALQWYAQSVAKGWRENIPHDWPPQVGQIINECWQEDPLQRPSMNQVLQRLNALENEGVISSWDMQEGQGQTTRPRRLRFCRCCRLQ